MKSMHRSFWTNALITVLWKFSLSSFSFKSLSVSMEITAREESRPRSVVFWLYILSFFSTVHQLYIPARSFVSQSQKICHILSGSAVLYHNFLNFAQSTKPSKDQANSPKWSSLAVNGLCYPECYRTVVWLHSVRPCVLHFFSNWSQKQSNSSLMHSRAATVMPARQYSMSIALFWLWKGHPFPWKWPNMPQGESTVMFLTASDLILLP